ncbi:hypothetical protein SGRIM128S_03291 [Streptomyces griseomycini]
MAASTGGGTGSGTRCARPPRRCRATSRGRTTVPGAVGSSSPRSSSQRSRAAGSAVTCPYGGPQTSRSSTSTDSCGAWSSSAAIRVRSVNRAPREATAETESCVDGSPAVATISWIRPGDIPAVASRTEGPSPVGDGCCGDGDSSSRAVRTSRSRSSPPHTRACSRRVPSACGSAAATAGSPSSPASSPSSSSYVAGSAATASAWAVCSANRSSRSSARTTEARVPARVASWVRSVGTGVTRSGRLRRSAAREASSRPRRASARERGAVAGFSSVLIRLTVAGGCAGAGRGVGTAGRTRGTVVGAVVRRAPPTHPSRRGLRGYRE